jgi:hypothetical protein
MHTGVLSFHEIEEEHLHGGTPEFDLYRLNLPGDLCGTSVSISIPWAQRRSSSSTGQKSWPVSEFTRRGRGTPSSGTASKNSISTNSAHSVSHHWAAGTTLNPAVPSAESCIRADFDPVPLGEVLHQQQAFPQSFMLFVTAGRHSENATDGYNMTPTPRTYVFNRASIFPSSFLKSTGLVS